MFASCESENAMQDTDGLQFHIARLKRRRSTHGAANSAAAFRAMFREARKVARDDLSKVKETEPDRSANILVRTSMLAQEFSAKHAD